MAIRQSTIAMGIKTTPQAFTAGAVVAVVAEFTIPAGMTVATSDIVELACLPADHRIVDAKVLPSGNFGSATADVGIMSGTFGDKDSVRTSGAEIFDDVALTALAGVAKSEGLLLAPSDADRGIGVKFSAAVTGAGQVIRLQLLLTQ